MPPVLKYGGPTPRESAMHRAVGRFITDWSHTEWILMLLMATILRTDVDRARMVLSASVNFRANRELILRLGRSYLLDADLPAFEEIMAKVKHLSEKRNMLAHHRAYHMKAATFRFFNDQDPTQPNTFGRCQDVQLGNIKTWGREARALGAEIMQYWEGIKDSSLLAQPRLIPLPEEENMDPGSSPG